MKQILKAVLFRFVAIVFGFLIAALLGELALRLIIPSRLARGRHEHSFFCRFDRQIGWVPLENVTGVHNAKRVTSVVHQNQYGMRGPDDIQLNKTSDKKRVLVIGDSYVWGFGADQSKLFSAPEVHGTDEEILNFGVSGYGTDQEYLFYLLKGEKFDVDQVVLAFTPYNDVANNLASKQYSYLKPYFTLNKGELVLHNDHVRNSRVRNFIRRFDRECRVWNLVGDGLQGFANTLRPKRKQKHAEHTLVVSDS